MNTNYTAFTLVVDRSGSMQSIANDVKGSVKQFINDQKKIEGKASFTLAQFDNQYEVVHDFKDINEIDGDKFAKEYCPRGSTSLLDAIGRATIAMQQKVDSMPDAEKPKRVVVAIITDGHENSSREFNLAQIKEMIKAKEDAGWDYMFMGATLDTIDIAKSMGFSASKTAVYDTSNFTTCMASISEQVRKARVNEEVKISQEERANLKKPTTTNVAAA